MAGKNTAVFGIYPTRTSAENAVDALKAANFRNTDISVLLPEGLGRRILLTRKIPRRRKVPQQAPEPVRYWAVVWVGYSVSVPSRFRGWGHSSPPDRLWRPLLEPESAERWAGSRVL